MTVKVQLPLSSSLPESEQLALIYSKDRSFEVMYPITEHIKQRMNGCPKAFFNLDTQLMKGTGEVMLGDEIPWQEW